MLFRSGALGDSELVARPLGGLRMSNLASPDYLRKQGTPRKLADLAKHHVVHYASTLSTQDAAWEYRDPADGSVRTLPMRATVTVNGTDAYHAAAVAGLGLIQAPAFGTHHLVQAGSLVEVLPRLTASPLQVSLLYAHRRQLAPRVQAVMTWLSQVLSPHLAEAGQR